MKPSDVASLGDRPSSDDGNAALRAVIAAKGPGRRDARCAAVLALAKRLRAGATPDLVLALADADGSVREYAVLCMAAVGDATGWDEVLAWLVRRLKKAPTILEEQPSPAIAACSYLARHADEEKELARLAAVLRKGWAKLTDSDRVHITRVWPEIAASDAPSGAPARTLLYDWSKHPLFGRL